MIILKATKNQCFILSLEDFFWKKYRGVKLPPPLHPPKGLKATRWPRQLILTIANQGHLGITRMKSLFREEVDKVCIRTNRTLRLIS